MSDFKWYVKHELQPAISFVDSNTGLSFIKKEFPELVTAIYNNREDVLFTHYVIKYKGVVIYIGESVKPYKRICVHIHHLYLDPQAYFGLTSSEVNNVTFEVLGAKYYNEISRKQAELSLRRQLAPVINPPSFGDHCILRNCRYSAIHHIWFNNPDKLKFAIETLVYKCPWSIDWREAHKTALKMGKGWSDLAFTDIDYEGEGIPYGLEHRIDEYFSSLSKEEYKRLSLNMGAILGYKAYVRRNTMLKVLTVVLSNTPDEKTVVKRGMVVARNFMEEIK